MCGRDFEFHIDRLIREMERSLGMARPNRSRGHWAIAPAVVVALLGVIGAGGWWFFVGEPAEMARREAAAEKTRVGEQARQDTAAENARPDAQASANARQEGADQQAAVAKAEQEERARQAAEQHLAMTAPGPATPDPARFATVKTPDDLKIRSGPSIQYHIVFVMYTGDRVRIIGDSNNGWKEIEFTAKDGQIYHGFSGDRYLIPDQ